MINLAWLKYLEARPSKDVLTLSGEHSKGRGKLRLIHLVFQSISGISPAGSIAATLTAAAYYARGALPFAQLLAFVAGYLLVNSTWWFSREIASSGGFLGFAAAGLGPRWGVVAGSLYILQELCTVGYSTLFLAGPLFSGVIETLTGKTYPSKVWIAIMFGFYILVALMIFSGIKLSLNVAAYTGIVELILLFIIAVVVAARAGNMNTGQAFNPENAKSTSDFAVGALLSLFTVAGYSSAVNLAEEVSRPRKLVPIGVLIGYTTCGALFTFSAYAFTVGWGYKDMNDFANELVPGIILTQKYADSFLAWVFFLFIFQSTFFIVVASFLVAVRITFALARDGIIMPYWLAKLDKRGEPVYANMFGLIICVIITLVTGLILGSDNGYNFLVTNSSLSIFSAHILVNISLAVYFWKKKKFNIFFHGIAPFLATGFLLFGIFFTMYPYDPLTLGAPIWTGIWLIISYALTWTTPKENFELYLKRLDIQSYAEKGQGDDKSQDMESTDANFVSTNNEDQVQGYSGDDNATSQVALQSKTRDCDEIVAYPGISDAKK
eukprot:jgi/Galph1/213/GphlegSOOS_G4895.1